MAVGFDEVVFLGTAVRFTGTGWWNGHAGHTFLVESSDNGEPGTGRDTFAVTVRNAQGDIVLQASGLLSAGNVDKLQYQRSPGGLKTRLYASGTWKNCTTLPLRMAALQAGSQIGSYVVLAPLGAGGMGEVYRSRDTKLKREVAIKVLPAEFSRDPERLRRFRREAELLATLNHPHVAQIYGIEEIPSTDSAHADEAFCLVLELVEGETLGDRLAHGAIPVDESLEIARQIAEALEAAHGQGIVHRDLKPANIKITPDGRVKVLDFGLAKPIGPDASDVGMSQSPTLATATIPGVILGTAAYMSPEQAKARAADARSDIWAFGCVLYEMLAGRPAFAGDTVVEILGAILKSEPDWHALPWETPPAVVVAVEALPSKGSQPADARCR